MEMDPQEEAELAELAKNDETAFSRLYDFFLPQIFGFVTRRISDRALAEDITSRVFLKVVEHIRRFDSRKSRFKTWIYTIAVNTLIDHFRSFERKSFENMECAESVPDPLDNPHHHIEKNMEKERILSLIEKLPVRHQRLLMLRYYSDFSIDEIADALKVSNNHVSVMLHRSLKAFSELYHSHDHA